MKRQFTHIRQKDFALVKQLQGLGLKPGQVTQITKRSHATIGRIFKCETYGDYRLMMQGLADKARIKRPLFTLPDLAVPIDPTEELEPENIITPSLEGILKEIKITNTLLREIINLKAQERWWSR